MGTKPLELDRTVFPFVALEGVQQFRLFVCDFVKAIQAKTEAVKETNFPARSFHEADPVANLRVALENVE